VPPELRVPELATERMLPGLEEISHPFIKTPGLSAINDLFPFKDAVDPRGCRKLVQPFLPLAECNCPVEFRKVLDVFLDMGFRQFRANRCFDSQRFHLLLLSVLMG